MLNECGSAMRTFTKFMKVTFADLQSKAPSSVLFVDDAYLQGETLLSCKENVFKALLRTLDFTI